MAAQVRLGTRVRRTPLADSPWLSETAGGEVRLKLECWQRTRSFKIRGALNAAHRLVAGPPRERAEGQGNGRAAAKTVVTASAGNHGLALATAARDAGLACVVFTPSGAPRAKIEAIRRAGAELRREARDYDEAERMALAWGAAHGVPFISPYNHPDVIAGAGTVGLEIVEEWPDVDLVVVPLGGGGLASGIALALAGSSHARVVGVEIEASQAFTTALAQGGITPIVPGPTLADGLGGNLEPGSITFEMVRDLLDSVVVVSEDQLRAAMRGLLTEERLVVEGAGAVAAAAVLGGAVRTAGQRVAVVVSGANVDIPRLMSVV